MYLALGNQNYHLQGKLRVGTNIGDIAPSFKVKTIEGKTLDSKSLKGKVVVITSSAAWRPTCVMEAQQFSPVYQKYKDKGVVFITVDIDPRDSKETIAKFKKDNNTPWYYTNRDGGRVIIERYNFNRFEITYIIDRNGIVRYKDVVITSSEKLEKEISKLLAE